MAENRRMQFIMLLCNTLVIINIGCKIPCKQRGKLKLNLFQNRMVAKAPYKLSRKQKYNLKML